MSDPVTAAADKVHSHIVMYGALLHAAGLHVLGSTGLPTPVVATCGLAAGSGAAP